MVRVAVCPKCSHESVMFDQADSEEWARCPECRTHFQIKQAAAREIPQLVMTKDEALLADKESEADKETVDSAALETRWDTRRTINDASTQTIAGVEPATANLPPEEQNGSEDPSPTGNGKDAARRTVSDLSSLATWNDLPIDQIEAEARAEEAGDAPNDDPLPSETPTLRLHRTRDTNEESGTTNSPQGSADSGDRFDKWFQTKATIFDFTPPTLDETDNATAVDAHPVNETNVSPTFDVDDRSEIEVESASDAESPDEGSSREDAEPESADANEVREDMRATRPPAWPHSPPVPNWARARRRRSPLRMFVMIGVGGIIGTALGYYALLWLFGPQRDFLNAGRYLPSAILPSEFRAREVKLPASGDVTIETRSESVVPAVDEQPADADTALPPAGADANGVAPRASDGIEIAGAPSFSADELAVALEKAKEARAGLVTGNFDDGAEVKRAKGQSYMAYCDLAQKATFVDKSSNASYASALEREVQELVRTTVTDAHTQDEVGRLVPLWIKSKKRTHAGIFFAGQVAREVRQGPIVEWQIDLGHESIPVLADASKALVDPSARPVVILGWIVDKPAEQVTGYTGQVQQAVWAGHIIRLD